MRQILFGEQWFHPEAPAEVVEIFIAWAENVLSRKERSLNTERLTEKLPFC